MESALSDPIGSARLEDRVRHGMLPASVESAAIVQQAAALASALAAKPDRWPSFRAELHEMGSSDPKALVILALALGWREKWRES